MMPELDEAAFAQSARHIGPSTSAAAFVTRWLGKVGPVEPPVDLPREFVPLNSARVLRDAGVFAGEGERLAVLASRHRASRRPVRVGSKKSGNLSSNSVRPEHRPQQGLRSSGASVSLRHHFSFDEFPLLENIPNPIKSVDEKRDVAVPHEIHARDDLAK